jgi:hypothetical protein
VSYQLSTVGEIEENRINLAQTDLVFIANIQKNGKIIGIDLMMVACISD